MALLDRVGGGGGHRGHDGDVTSRVLKPREDIISLPQDEPNLRLSIWKGEKKGRRGDCGPQPP